MFRSTTDSINLYTDLLKNIPIKRKVDSELSTNPRTIKSRQRNQRLTEDEFQAKIAKAKANDQGVITYTKDKLVKILSFQEAILEQ